MQDDTPSAPAAPATPDAPLAVAEVPHVLTAEEAADSQGDESVPVLPPEASGLSAEPAAVAAPDPMEGAEPATAEAAQSAPVAPPTARAAVPDMSPAACGARLTELFPALFAQGGHYGPMKPLKLRIQADLQQRAPGIFSRRTLGIFFSRYTTGNAYLKALTLAPHRFDLDGQAAGEIAVEHRQMAAEELARRHALHAERRAAQQPPPRREAPAAEGAADPDAMREARPERQLGQRPEARRDQRSAARPSVHPPRPALDSGQRAEPSSDMRPSSRRERPPGAQRPRDHAPRDTRLQRAPPHAVPAQIPAPAALPADPAQRERALLRRAFESSPLSKANFCALKGISEAALDAAMAGASAERGGR